MDNNNDTNQNGATQADGEKFRRKTYIVDPRFQWKYTTIIVLLGAGVAALMGAFLYRAYAENTRILDIDPRYAAEMQRADQIFLLYLIALVVVMAVALGFWGIIVTHRISGPLYILGRYLGVLADGRFPDLRPLRRKDELHEFFNAFADAIAALKAREKGELRHIGQAMEVIDRALDGGGDDAKLALQDVKNRLEKMSDDILTALGEDVDDDGVLVEDDE